MWRTSLAGRGLLLDLTTWPPSDRFRPGFVTIMLGGATYVPADSGVTLGHHDLSATTGRTRGSSRNSRSWEVETMKAVRDCSPS